jgi:hypothetical protein
MDDSIVSAMPSPKLPESVLKRDGRLVPFDADKISQSLYAATEQLGQPSAFLARELTDGVLHFLAADVGTEPPTTTQIAELVAKVVRELGQPALAHAYQARQSRDRRDSSSDAPRAKPDRSAAAVPFFTCDAPQAVVRRCLRSYSLQAVFSRDLAAAHEEGLITLSGLEHPDELTRMVLNPGDGDHDWLTLINMPARELIYDSPEYALSTATAKAWLAGLAAFCEATGRTALVNLNIASPPAWADRGGQGPLFNTAPATAPADRSSALADVLADESRPWAKFVRPIWHVTDADFAPERLSRLEKVARRAAAGAGFGFALDRPKRPIILGPGLERRHMATLLDVSLDLRRFLGMAEVNQDARLFLDKLPSLARMAVRAGIQKRNFLRTRCGDHPELARGFLLERARLVVVPTGLDQVVQKLLNQSMAGSNLSLDLGRRIVEVLQRTLQTEGLAANLEIALDGSAGQFPGLDAPVDSQHLHAAGVLHGIAGFGLVLCPVVTGEELLAMLPYGLRKTELARMEVIKPEAPRNS